jgi:hypothetical protein
VHDRTSDTSLLEPAAQRRPEPPPREQERPVAAAPRILSPAHVLALQRTAGNGAVSRLLARDGKQTADQRLDALENAQKVEEKKNAANTLDLKWRATYGKRLSGYRETVYALTAGFQTAIKNFDGAQTQQAQAEAMKDQVLGAIVNVAAAGLAQPLLSRGFGLFIKNNLDKWIEMAENPVIQAVQGGVSIKQTQSGQQQANQAASGGQDPLVFLAANLKDIETQTGKTEQAFIDRGTKTAAFTPEQWIAWHLADEEARFKQALEEVDKILIPDPSLLEAADTLAAKLEIYYWSAWIKTNYVPGTKGLQVGAKLASRMKAIGIESLADVRFDTSSWIFMDHQPPPPQFEERLAKFAKEWSQPLVSAKK